MKTRRMIAVAAACGMLLGSGAAVAATRVVPEQRAEQERGQQKDRAQAQQGKGGQQNDRAQANQRAQQNDRAQPKQRAPQNDRAQQNQRAPQNDRAQQNQRAPQNDRAQNDRGQGNDRAVPGADRGNGNGGAARVAGRGRLTAADVQARMNDLPAEVRRFERSDRQNDRMAVNAVARGVARGMSPGALSLRVVSDRIRVQNDDGDVLLDLSEAKARDLGAWEMRMLGDRRPVGNAPAFCRSGAGHPVWGRDWCLDKGFGLGHDNDDMLWSRGTVGDIIFGRTIGVDRLDRPSLLDVLGDVVFGRLALHALTLGFTQPLTGVYVAEPASPRLLRIQSDGVDVAEMIDVNGDNRVDVLYVTQYR